MFAWPESVQVELVLNVKPVRRRYRWDDLARDYTGWEQNMVGMLSGDGICPLGIIDPNTTVTTQ